MEATRSFIRFTVLCLMWAVGVEAVAFFVDMFDATFTNPVWDRHYNWLPLLTTAVAGSVVAAALRTFVVPRVRTARVYRSPAHTAAEIG